MLAGWIETGDIRQAIAQATVSAAIAIEQVGPPLIDDSVMTFTRLRAEKALKEIRPLDYFE